MRVCAVSDLHGFLPDVPPCDLLLLGGDLCPVRDHSIAAQAAFLGGPFARWLDGVPAAAVVGVAGNHDFIFERDPAHVPAGLRWTYLQDSGAEVGGLKIWGTPWQPWFYDWAFNAPPPPDGEPFLERKWAMVPDDTDVLVLHGPPAGYGDRNVAGQPCGSPSLTERILALRPKLAIFGHIHEGRGQWDVGGVTLANVSYVDEHYRPVHAAMTFDL